MKTTEGQTWENRHTARLPSNVHHLCAWYGEGSEFLDGPHIYTPGPKIQGIPGRPGVFSRAKESYSPAGAKTLRKYNTKETGDSWDLKPWGTECRGLQTCCDCQSPFIKQHASEDVMQIERTEMDI